MAGKGNGNNDAAGPSAFEIRLGISAGRNSESQAIMVNADTTVNWIFRQGAYVLSHIHGKDWNALQNEFDLYLVRPDKDDICLNPARVIADYRVKKYDELQLRHKTLPIPICVNLCEGDDRKIEVNSGFPLMDIVPSICKDIGIQNYQELSIALPTSGPGENTMQYEWLDLGSSLNGQGIQQGDTLLLRKKFFILNDDIQEALDGNEILMDMMYQQIHQLYTTESCIGSGSDDVFNCAKLSSLLHHIELNDENISDEESVSKVMPKHLQGNSKFFGQTVTAYYSERVGTLKEYGAKKILLGFFLGSQSIIANYFPVKKLEDSQAAAVDLVLLVTSDRIKVCRKPTTDEQLQIHESMEWRLRDLRDTECTSQKDQHLRINVLGSWYEFVTDYRTQISRYLLEAQRLVKQRVSKARVSTVAFQETNLSDLIQAQIKENSTSKELPKVMEDVQERKISPKSTDDDDYNEEVVPEERVDQRENILVEESFIKSQSPTDVEIVGDPSSVVVVDVVEDEVEDKVEDEVKDEVKDNAEAGSTPTPTPVGGEEEGKQAADEPVLDTPPLLNTSFDTANGDFDLSDIDEALECVSGGSTSSASTEGPVFHAPPPPPPPPPPIQMNEIQKSPAKSISSTSSYVHIPQFLESDFRQVLEDYRLFHIVVLKQDVRTVLLNINDPVQKVVELMCGTFDIRNPSSYYLWIPTGIQTIIEKYGGRPVLRGGKFVKQRKNSKDFTPRLDVSKSLKEQYNFSIKPFLLHLRHYQGEEGVDGPGETNCGVEWPSFENPDVARYRRFYQSWTGIVQGAFPIERKGAVKLAALLTHIYYGDREKSRVWPPYDYDAKIFLPEKHKNSFGIVSDVEKLHRDLSGNMTQQCINDVVDGCQKIPTLRGVFFEVAVPVKRDIMAVIPWNKMERRWFGINQNGVFSIGEDTGELNFTQKLCDIVKWSSSENSFKLTFKDWVFDVYTYQAKEIRNTLELFVQMTIRGVSNVPEEPEKHSLDQIEPEKNSRPTSQAFNDEYSDDSKVTNGSMSYGSTPLKLERKQSGITTPTAFDL